MAATEASTSEDFWNSFSIVDRKKEKKCNKQPVADVYRSIPSYSLAGLEVIRCRTQKCMNKSSAGKYKREISGVAENKQQDHGLYFFVCEMYLYKKILESVR